MVRSFLFLSIVMWLFGCAVSPSSTSSPAGQTITPPAPSSVPVLVQAAVARAEPTVSDDVLQAQGEANTAFAVEFYRQVQSDQKGNFLFSPYSIRTAFGMVYAGARGNTEAEMEQVFHYGLPQDELHPALNRLNLNLTANPNPGAGILTIANGVWAQQGFEILPPYLTVLAEQYGAGINTADFTTPQGRDDTANQINSWVNDETQGEIPLLIQPQMLTDLTRLVLANAIYFKGTWEAPFEVEMTRDAPFTTLAGSTVSVPMMSQQITLPYVQGDGWQAVALAYKGGKTRFVAILPDDFTTFESGITLEQLADIQQSLSSGTITHIVLSLPKFEDASELSLPNTLKALGMHDAFDEGLADLSGIDGRTDLFVAEAVHKATLTVDEVGTVAAAATGVIINTESVPPSLVFDHPFLYFIEDISTGTILFMGRKVE